MGNHRVFGLICVSAIASASVAALSFDDSTGLLQADFEQILSTRVAMPNVTILKSKPRMPQASGCFAWMPLGCPRQKGRVSEEYAKWRVDSRGKNNIEECKARGPAFDHWCGSERGSVVMIFVGKVPQKPGCYAWMPFGCPRQQAEGQDSLPAYNDWHIDPRGAESSEACKERGAAFDKWCGRPDSGLTQMRFVSDAASPADAKPSDAAAPSDAQPESGAAPPSDAQPSSDATAPSDAQPESGAAPPSDAQP